MFNQIIQFIRNDFPAWDGVSLIGYSFEHAFSNVKIQPERPGYKQYSFRVMSLDDGKILSREITYHFRRFRKAALKSNGNGEKRTRAKSLKSLEWGLPVYLNVFFKKG